jgi:hypothetical protein
MKVSAAPWIPGVTDAEALLDAVGDAAQVWFTVLNVHDPHVASTRFGRRFDRPGSTPPSSVSATASVPGVFLVRPRPARPRLHGR